MTDKIKNALLAAAFITSTWSPYAVLAADTAYASIGSHIVLQGIAGNQTMSAAERGAIIQRNLENALVAATDRSPAAVGVTYVKGTPVITLSGYQVATVDAKSSKLAGTTPALLAQRWANSIRSALGDSRAVSSHIAQITGEAYSNSNGRSTEYAIYSRTALKGRIAYAPAGLVIKAKMDTAITTQLAQAGDPIQATIKEDIVLGDAKIPAGSLLMGKITDAKAGAMLAKPGTLSVKFDRLRTPDGIETPMSARLIGGIGAQEGLAAIAADQVRAESNSEKIKKAAVHTAIGAGAGALVGTAIGAIAGNGRGAGRGAWSGAAIGGGLGLAQALLLRKGQDIHVKAGQDIQLQLESPMTIASAQPVTQ